MTTAFSHPARSPRGRLVDAAARLDTGRVLISGLVAIALLGVLGVGHIQGWLGVHGFDLDGEWNAPALFSGIQLACGALIAAVLALGDELATFAPISGVLGLASADETFSVHEFLEDATGIDWQLLYLPAFAATAVAWAVVVRRSDLRARVTLGIAGAALVISQIFEKIQWNRRVPVSYYNWLMVPEELLEDIGGLLILTVLLARWQARRIEATTPLPGRGTTLPG